jgi:putative CocE/NonD family hydrolase
MGPWHHGQQIADGSSLGAIRFDSDTGLYFRRKILRPFLDHYLQDAAPKHSIAPVSAFETGTNEWRQFTKWPTAPSRSLYLNPGNKLSFTAPQSGPAFEEYVSDPAKPVPFRARPIQPTGYTGPLTWSRWLVDDQREASGRPDVVSFVSEPLETPLNISGEPIANLVAATTGTDSDWVIKLIDLYPDQVAGKPEMGGYQLMISADIFRGRYRESLETARPIEAGKPLPYRFALPVANHVVLPGHRLMVQIQSSWFPLYDRNPQTFVANPFWAKPEDHKKATQRIYHAPGQATFIALPVVP